MRHLILAALLAGCEAAQLPAGVPDADPELFRDTVYPILLTDCAFSTCHGDPRRFFSVHGPGRTRLDASTDVYAPATAEELAHSYTRARSMLLSVDGVRRAPLLRKPLATSAGGAGHEGDDPFGAAIFASKRDPRYEALFFWATSGEAQP